MITVIADFNKNPEQWWGKKWATKHPIYFKTGKSPGGWGWGGFREGRIKGGECISPPHKKEKSEKERKEIVGIRSNSVLENVRGGEGCGERCRVW